ncbi:NAD-dependent epimerase/dehydratase family protein [Kitasatospora sp. NPDC004669]|uniref:NAD-dependent epimerase/dehydratase family protein n=1 Tax=Kitasatospora sp. NPDC004669 TaxID=3154555 RepID=UPI0033A49C36
MPPTVLITGAAGFVGGHVAREARRHHARLRLTVHRRTPCEPTADLVHADLAEPASLPGICEGVDVLIHCAAQIGGDAETNEAVNARGTAALVAEARRAGVRRIVQLSTASVYGRGTFRGSHPEDLVRNPGSATSRTRAGAEDAVLGAGGVVLRPHLVYGSGDAWVGPGIAGILRALPGTVDGWPARTSMIAVTDLARLLVAAGLAPAGTLSASVYHAAHPEPVAIAALLRAVAACGAIACPAGRIDAETARAALAARGLPSSSLDMLTTDHVFDGTRLWADLGQPPGVAFPEGWRRSARWYREVLRAG